MSLKLADNQVTICLKNEQAYPRDACDLCAAKIFPEWEALKKDVKKAEEYVTEIISKFKES